jgi:gliding motility-associated-like protein
LTLKRYIILAGLFLSSFIGTAQNFNNIEFIENKGQWDSRVKYMADVSGGAIFIRSSGFTVLQHNQTDLAAASSLAHGHNDKGELVSRDKSITLRSHSFNVDFVGASPSMKVVADKSVDTYNNYFFGSDPSKWASGCRVFQGITLENVYPNIDVRYYTHNGMLKYDIIAKPGADISRIALKYEGVDKISVKNKELVIATSVGQLKESYPYSYQLSGNERTDIAVKYSVDGDIVRFIAKDRDPQATLIIDPTLVYCSFSKSDANNWGFTATYGSDGSTFGGGIVWAVGFPVSPGAFQSTFGQGNFDIGIIKLSPDGVSRRYATYIGGSGEDQPHSLMSDGQGNLVIAGRTNSSNYPLKGGTTGSGSGGGYDISITKLNALGTDIIGSRKIGGTGVDGVNIKAGRGGMQSLEQNYGDDGRSEVILDGAGNIYVASCTQSTDFPINGTVFQSTNRGSQDGVVIKLNSTLTSVLFSTYLGGDGNDAAYVLALGPTGDIYVGGGTASSTATFIGDHSGTIGPANNPTPLGTPSIDGFVAQISNNGSTIVRSTFLGTPTTDQVFGIQFDRNGFPYVMGQTSGDWPVINAAYSNTNGKQFVAKLLPDLSSYVYSTVFGTGSTIPNISPVAFLIDRCENVYVSGWGGNVSAGQQGVGYPSAGTTGLPVTSDAIKSNTDNGDFYFIVIKKNATGLLYGSFFGQNGGFPDHVDGGTSRFDQNGVIHQAICANCGGGGTFPTTAGVWGPSRPSSAFCNLAMVKIAFNLAGVGSGIQSSILGVPRDTAGCVPLTVDFTDTIANAVTYEWYFNYVPGNPPDLITTTPNASFTYTTVGTFPVMLVAVDPNTCNVRDSSFTNIKVGDIQANLAMAIVKQDPCDAFRYRFDNLSIAPAVRPFGPTSFVWDFGDGSPTVVAGLNSVFHNYAGPGTYIVRLTLQDTGYCNSQDVLIDTLSVATLVKARITTPLTGCVPYNAIFSSATSDAAETYLWLFGDGNTSTDANPTHLYLTAGFYDVVLITYNPNTCNQTDTARVRIQVFDKPVAAFTHSPVPPLVNTPTIFSNFSSADAVRFKWVFGDGDSLLTTSRAPVKHQYNATGTFTACLTAYNAADCDSTVCLPVEALIDPLVDVPKAFTPNSGDINSVVFAQGFGIVKIQFTIWNRQGLKVFQTNNRLQGWDGKYKGVVQPMDVYVYTLSVEFFDGTKTTRKGDITLIR